VKNFSLQPQNIYMQLSGNFSPIFQLNLRAISAQILCKFCIFPRDFLQGLNIKQQHLLNGIFSTAIWISRHHKGKLFWILMKHSTMGWQ